MSGYREARNFKIWKVQCARGSVIGRYGSDGGNSGHDQKHAFHGGSLLDWSYSHREFHSYL
jgi:hypothetical protein